MRAIRTLITNALFVSGGVKQVGSLRNIQLKRAGRTVTTLDLYDLLLKGDTRADVMAHVRAKLGSGIEATAIAGSAEPSPISPTSAPAYGLLNRTLRSLFPEVVVAPGLMIAGTDAHHYAIVSDNIYRFSPVRAKPGDLSRFHGTDERISVANLGEVVRFYHQLLRNLNAPASDSNLPRKALP